MPRLLVALVALALLGHPVAAQSEVPSLRWRTITTEHFRIHYEPQLEAWAQDLASRMEPVRSAVAARVGYTPPQVIDIVVEDPLNTPNGSAWPFLYSPAMRFWATPPAPSTVLGSSRGWGEILSVHEYAHLAHLLRPSRKPFAELLSFFAGIPVGPIAFGAPAWVSEGYATVIEGELTGEGRPNGVARPAILRQLAIEGYLPAYDELDATNRFQGGAMRYLVGSAYLEWLQSQRGDSVLPQLWRRMTARTERSFPDAFKGSFGDSPDVLYGRFTAQLTANAMAAKSALEAQGLARGELIQHWTWGVGAPALSPDGKQLVVSRSSPSDGARLQVLSFAPESLSAKRIARDSTKRAERFKKDPEDVLEYDPYPKALRVVETLAPTAGEAYGNPRWTRDGKRVLATRLAPLPDGRLRPDLFVWTPESGDVRRVTRGEGIVLADALPDASHAAALTCGAGTCSLVMVDLANGNVSSLAAGGIDQSYAGVRVSPNGKMVASARQRGARWDLVIVDIETRSARVVGPRDDASRYSPAWENDSTLIVVSEASGIATLERVTLSGAAVSVVARTTGSAQAPEVGPDGRVWWLDMHGRGWDLRVSAAGTALPTAPALEVALAPAVRRSEQRLAQQFAVTAVPPSRRYGLGPFGGSIIAGTTTAPDGESWSVGGSAGDLLGRYSLFFLAGGARAGGWHGGRTAVTYRGFRPEFQLQLFSAGHDPSRQGRNGGIALNDFDMRYTGGLAAVSYARSSVLGLTTLRAGISSGSVDPVRIAAVDRSVRFASIATNARITTDPKSAIDVGASATYSAGTTNDADWTRWMGEAFVSFSSTSAGGIGLRARTGEVNSGAPGFEDFVIGGSSPAYIDAAVLSQRVEHLGLPFAARTGRRMAMLSAETSGPFRLYHDWIAAGANFRSVDRIIGAELSLMVPRLGVLRSPAGSVKFGVSHGLEGVTRNATIGYLGLNFFP